MRVKDVILVLSGAVIGAGIALLTAPDSGVRTRRRIKRFYEDGVDKVADKYHDVCEDLGDGARELKRKVKRYTR